MPDANIPVHIPDIEQVKKQFKSWRQTRKRTSPIPDDLWQSAIDLCGSHSVTLVSKALRLGYNDLKRKVQSSETDPPVAPLFIELPNQSPDYNAKWAIEITVPSGATMNITHTGAEQIDITDLIKQFLMVQK